jgi:hypothetical protein
MKSLLEWEFAQKVIVSDSLPELSCNRRVVKLAIPKLFATSWMRGALTNSESATKSSQAAQPGGWGGASLTRRFETESQF